MTVRYETALRGCVRRTALASAGGLYMSYILAEEETDGGHTYSVFAAACGEGGESDCATLRGLTDSYEAASDFFRLISDGAVTPCTLSAVAEDFAASFKREE